jgi:hypothetical protein
MRRFQILLSSILLCCLYSTANADIYAWTDENGVRHFTNYAPPPQANIVMKSEELPYDELADRERMELERQDQLAAALQELADKEARLAEMQLAAEKRIEAANRKAEAALEQAEALLDQVQYESSGDTGSRYLHYGYYYPYNRRLHHSIYDRWYYRKRHSIYHKKPHARHYHKHHYKKMHRYNKQHDDKYRGGHRQRYQTGTFVSKRHSMSIRGGTGHRSRTFGQRSFGFRK